MRNSIFLLPLFLASFTASSNELNSINPIIGNRSFVEKFGFEPDNSIDDQLRIKTHLQFVEELLSKRSIKHLTKAEQKNRKTLLSHLKDYWQNSTFPINADHKNRKPCFIDGAGNICAVGYLVEQSTSREIAESINKKFQYATITEMLGLKTLVNWIKQSGLTIEECAMIQPNYGWYGQHREPPLGYQATSSMLTALNSYSTAAGIYGNTAWSVKMPYVGLIGGLGQTSMGLFAHSRRNAFFSGPPSANFKMLYGMNIGIGLTSTIINGFKIYNTRKSRMPKTSYFSPSSFYLPDEQIAVGFQFVKRF